MLHFYLFIILLKSELDILLGPSVAGNKSEASLLISLQHLQCHSCFVARLLFFWWGWVGHCGGRKTTMKFPRAITNKINKKQ